ncbi:MAG: competence/damage-inducible protein A [Candidatus Wallbacteria bacterium]|nr:competence/damage-inducible protein A [Candidatus Wallbacteria bacterium]
MSAEKTAAVLVIGNEVLSGKVEESNATFLIHQLRELGVPLRLVQVIPDEAPTIAEAVAAASGKFDFVFTTGGIGPTHDDMTVPSIARGLGLEMELNSQLDALLHRYCGGEPNEHLRRMAWVPKGSELLWAAGLTFPVLLVRNIYVFPGDPKILRKKFLAIRDRFRTAPYTLLKLFTTCEEGEIAAMMEEAEKRCPGVQIGSYPVYDNPEYKVQITVESKEPAKARETLSFLAAHIPAASIVRME